MKLQSAWRTLRWSVAQRGVGGTVRVALQSARRKTKPAVAPVHPFDERYGTNTGGLIGGGALGVGGRHDAFITAYVGVTPSRLQAGLETWKAALMAGERVADFCFVDLGCGKGRALLLARAWAFRAVQGVELNPALVEIARQNVATWQGTLQRENGPVEPIEVVCGDATEVPLPAGAVLLFMYNPFGVPVLQAVLEALERHVRATGARVDVLFQNEGPELPLRTDPRLKLLWTGSLPIAAEDAAAELVGSAEDVTSLYRWVG